MKNKEAINGGNINFDILLRKLHNYSEEKDCHEISRDSLDIAFNVRQLSHHAKSILANPEIKFHVNKNKTEEKSMKWKNINQEKIGYSEKKGIALFKFLYQLDHESISRLKQFELFPPSALFIYNLYTSELIDHFGHNLLRREKDNKSLCVEKLNNFLKSYREEYYSSEFQRTMNSHIRRTNKNRKGVEDLIDDILAKHSRIEAIRIDCTYRRKQDLKTDELATHITEEKARSDLKTYFHNLQRLPHFKNILGYVIKMERGIEKGLHFHMLFIMDGRKHQQDILLAKMLGEAWESVTNREGIYFNCNKKWKDSQLCAVGTIHRGDYEKIARLKSNVITYMTKIDEYVLFKPLLTGRTLFRSQIKKVRK